MEAVTLKQLIRIGGCKCQNPNIYEDECLLVHTTQTSDEVLALLANPVRTTFNSLVLCLDGETEVLVDMRPFRLKKSTLCVIRAGHLCQARNVHSQDLWLLMVEPRFMNRMIDLQFNQVVTELMVKVSQPVLELDEESEQMVRRAFEVVWDILQIPNRDQTYDMMIRSVLQSFATVLLHIISTKLPQLVARQHDYSSDEQRFRSFLQLVEHHFRDQHQVQFYAQQMNITPKYLGTIVRQVSQRGALDWIDDYLLSEAKSLLRYSDRSVQEIAYYLNFPNQSFFGKWFKRRVGLSPVAFR